MKRRVLLDAGSTGELRPLTRLQTRMISGHHEVADQLKGLIFGQDAVIDELMMKIRRHVAARRPNRPIAVFLFAGPPGVGKTQLAMSLADVLYNSEGLVHIDMGEFGRGPESVWRVFGTPPGYIRGGGGSLTTALQRRSDAVVILDSIDRAHPDAMMQLLAGWNDGYFTDRHSGLRIRSDGAIFILTSNVMSREIGELAANHLSSLDELSDAVKNMLSTKPDGLSPEVLSRIDTVFAFRTLQGIDIACVAALQIERLTQSYCLEIADGGIHRQTLIDVVEALTKTGLKGGVRDITMRIERMIVDGLVDAKTGGASKVRFELADGAVKVVPARH